MCVRQMCVDRKPLVIGPVATGNIPDSLGNLSGLTELLLEGNKLEGEGELEEA